MRKAAPFAGGVIANPIEKVVIVGAGLAGDCCAFALRQAGFQGKITLLSAESIRPYDRPPLSKVVLKERGAEHSIFLRSGSEYREAGIELRLGCSAEKLRPGRGEVILHEGEVLSYDRLVLATGSRLRTLPFLPRGARGIFYLRNYADSLALRDALDTGGRVAVVGGGVIGLEVAAAASSRASSVTVIEPAARVMSRAVGTTVAQMLARKHASAGVKIRCGVGVAAVNNRATGYDLILSDGDRVDADIVVVGVGVLPDVRLAQAANLAVTESGVVVDGFGRTSHPDVFAAGEVAFHYNERSGRHERQENWFHAAAHGEHVARSLLGQGPQYREIGSFWTDQYDTCLQSIGLVSGVHEVVRGERSGPQFVVFHMTDDSVIGGASGVNAASELRQAKALIDTGVRVDVSCLADPSVKVSAAALQV